MPSKRHRHGTRSPRHPAGANEPPGSRDARGHPAIGCSWPDGRRPGPQRLGSRKRLPLSCRNRAIPRRGRSSCAGSATRPGCGNASPPRRWMHRREGAGHRARKFRLTVMARSCRTGLSRVEPVRVSRPECVIAIRCSGRCPGQCSRPQVAILHMPYMKKTFFSFNVLLKYSHLGPLPLKAWRSGQNCHAFFC